MNNTYVTNCHFCGKEFERHNRQNKKYKENYALKCGHKHTTTDREFCSVPCYAQFNSKKETLNCGWCRKEVIRTQAELKKSKSGLAFCDRSCSVSFNNTKKRKSKRSKCEILLFDLLKQKYVDLDLLSNDKSMLDGFEVDIAIPSLSLAIEWNGIVHFKPIYGDEKLLKIQNIDLKKQAMAEEKKIRLIIIADLI